jgi:hypothetical protein
MNVTRSIWLDGSVEDYERLRRGLDEEGIEIVPGPHQELWKRQAKEQEELAKRRPRSGRS